MKWIKKRKNNDCLIEGNTIKEVFPSVSPLKPGLWLADSAAGAKDDAVIESDSCNCDIVIESDSPDNGPDTCREAEGGGGDTSEGVETGVVVHNPPAPYMPSFLTDDNADADLGGFMHFMQFYCKYTTRYRNEQFISLKNWKKALGGELSADSIQRVLDDQAHRAAMLMVTIRNYGRYRNMHGDPRILTILATSMTIKRPRYRRKGDFQILSKGQLEIYEAIARKKCGEGDRAGIYIGLSLLGVGPTEVLNLRYENHGVNKIHIDRTKSGGEIELKAPPWLIKAMDAIPETKWRKQRTTVRAEISKYETTPRVIIRSVNHHRRK